jgi:hypothetical protein
MLAHSLVEWQMILYTYELNGWNKGRVLSEKKLLICYLPTMSTMSRGRNLVGHLIR